MAVPTFDTLFEPLMQLMGDGRVRSLSQLRDEAAVRLRISEEVRAQMIRSGRQSAWDNRCGWAVTYLAKAGYLSRPQRGQYVITDSGRRALEDPAIALDLEHLRSLEAVKVFEGTKGDGGAKSKGETNGSSASDSLTPDEQIQNGFEQYHANLSDDLLDRLKKVAPSHFEQIVVELLVAMGYGGSFDDAASAVGRTGDGGIDGVIKEDRLGLDAIYVQAKRWQGSVGSPTVSEFIGALAARHGSKGVLITTGTFTAAARDFVSRIAQRIILVDGPMLADLMIEHGIGVTPVRTLVLKRIDTDYFENET